MANKRDLKKQIKYICGEIAVECILARECVEGIDMNKMNKIVFDIADLQQKSLKNATFSFDKTPSDFESRKAYHHAANAYFKNAYKVFYAEFNKHIQSIVKQMNELLPAAQREINKKLANA